MSKRKALNFYKSYWDIWKELSTNSEKVELLEIIAKVQFLETHIDDVVIKNSSLKLVFASIKHSLEASVHGFCSKEKIDYNSLRKTTPCQGGYEGGGQGGSVPPSVQVQGEEQEKGEEQVQEQYRNNYRSFQDEFDFLWNMYPVKKGRKDAMKHFKATVKNREDVLDIKFALDNYLQEIKSRGTEARYIKHGGTWFNNWKDYMEVEKHERKIAGISEDFLKQYINGE